MSMKPMFVILAYSSQCSDNDAVLSSDVLISNQKQAISDTNSILIVDDIMNNTVTDNDRLVLM